MKRLAIIPILMVVGMSLGYSQADTTKGIAFEHGLSWEEVFQKAKEENKYVFVDCYASWCGPCKGMDKNVYPIDSVGVFMNEKCISVRMQMDTTGQDKDEIRQWYGIAHAVGEKYHIEVYPTYLFFSPDGQVLHKDIGGKSIKGFLSMVRAAMDPQQQYYTLLADYQKGNMNYTIMPILANATQRLGAYSLSRQVNRDYVHRYLETLPEEKLWTRDNILFVNKYWVLAVIDLNDKIFQLYYRDRVEIDSVMHDGHFSDRLINNILYRDEVKPLVDKALTGTTSPRWHHLEKAISKNYDVFYAKNNVLEGRQEYYKAKKRWKKYIQYFFQQQEINGIENWQADLGITRLVLNDDAYEVFEYSSNRRELEKALSWVNRALAADNIPDPRLIDTKANLLYKLGKKFEGLVLEEKSYTLLPEDKEIAANYEKMKNGLPTWSSE
jgi:thiol-disulfide isomerase/thioredoxin